MPPLFPSLAKFQLTFLLPNAGLQADPFRGAGLQEGDISAKLRVQSGLRRAILASECSESILAQSGQID